MKSSFSFLLLTFHMMCYSQNRKVEMYLSEFDTIVYNHSFLSFSISPYLVNKAKATPVSGTYRLKTIYMNGFEAGPDYYINFNKNYSLITGLHGGAAARNYNFFVSKNDFVPSLQSDIIANGALSRTYDFYICIPVWFQRRWYTQKNNQWTAVAGVNVRYYPIAHEDVVDQSADYIDGNGNQIIVLELDYSIGNNLLPWLNYNIGGGYSLMLRNHNFLQCNLIANFSNTKLVKGTYTINVTGKPQSTGNYSANLSYIGLDFSYIFTGANKRLRKMYEKNTSQ